MLQPLLAEVVRAERGLDFGSGDGAFASLVLSTGRVGELVPVDVMARPRSVVQPILYDGRRLPFDDGEFDLAYAIDVLHHCPEPTASLRDLARVTSRWLLVKDHTWERRWQKSALALMDELGNRRFGVPCLYHHQRGWSWDEVLRHGGFERVRLVHPAPCHVGAMRWANWLEYIALWRRAEPPS